ncbi:MAG: metalloregulator ArsR/SmtB family transcription factor [Rickettsiales bacterium]|nr:metalloregulator ArsR/SmtB family transcription factor [Rickettsiales bacterium]
MKVRNAVIAFDALSHNLRVKVFRKLLACGKQGMGAAEICEAMEVAPATLSFHMSKLVNGDLVDIRKKGKFVIYTANYNQVEKLTGFLTEKSSMED